MDFALTEEQQALGDLARQIFADRCTHDRFKALEAEADAIFDRDLWSELSKAGITASVVPEAHGGSGLGLLDLLTALEAAGEHVAPVPLVPTLVLGVLPLMRFGSEDQQAALLPGVVDGSRILTAALEEAGNDALDAPTTRYEDGKLYGEKVLVAYAEEASHLVVSATGPDGPALYLLDASVDGVAFDAQVPTNRQPQASVRLDGAEAAPLGSGVDAITWLVELGTAAYCVLQTGVCEGALRMTATHTSNREQFGKPIAEFQAVAQRAADAFIDTEMIRLTAWHALYRLSAELDATKEVHGAKFWAGDASRRVVHAAQHLHGGLGVDVDYPLHRYFAWARQLEHTLGTPTRELIRLGTVLADEPA